jgi:hypothetical protein
MKYAKITMMELYSPKEKHFLMQSVFEDSTLVEMTTDFAKNVKGGIIGAIRRIYTFKRTLPKMAKALSAYGISQIRLDIELNSPEEEWLGQELFYGIADLAIKFSGRKREYTDAFGKILSRTFTKANGFSVGFDEGNLMDQHRGWLVVKAYIF